MLQCKQCGKPFEKPKNRGRGRLPSYCSDECRHEERKAHWRRQSRAKAQREKQERHAESRNCKRCGKAFSLSEGGYTYCSEGCQKKQTSKNKNAARRARLKHVDYTEEVTPQALVARDGVHCCHCNEMLTEEFPGQIDHIIPLSRGGVHALYNTQLLCDRCNRAKWYTIPLQDLEKARRLWPEAPRITERDPRRNILARRVRPNSGYRGVTAHRNKWKCKIEFEGRAFRKGGFETAEDAARHYNYMCDLLGLGPEYQNEVKDNANP